MSEETIKDLIRIAKNSYHRKWQQNNPEKVKKAQQKYWEKKALASQNQERSN